MGTSARAHLSRWRPRSGAPLHSSKRNLRGRTDFACPCFLSLWTPWSTISNESCDVQRAAATRRARARSEEFTQAVWAIYRLLRNALSALSHRVSALIASGFTSYRRPQPQRSAVPNPSDTQLVSHTAPRRVENRFGQRDSGVFQRALNVVPNTPDLWTVADTLIDVNL